MILHPANFALVIFYYYYCFSFQRGGDPAGAELHHQLGPGHVPRGDGHAGQGEDDYAQRGVGADRVHLLGQDGHTHPGMKVKVRNHLDMTSNQSIQLSIFPTDT